VRVETAVAALSEQVCEIIIPRQYPQLSYQEVAHALGLTEPASSMRYLRSIRRLPALLQGSLDSLS